jgi:hypothetical protein
MAREVVKVLHYKAGYEVRTERISGEEHGMPEGAVMDMRCAYTPEGDYLGDPKMARYLVVKRGIRPEKAAPDHNVCSIGFCEREQKWYGWSHRAIYGYGIGDVAQEGSLCTQSGSIPEYVAEHPEADLSVPVGFTADTLDDAKRMAIAFADSVG